MFNKFSLTILVVAAFVFYLKYTEQFYQTCRNSIKDENFFEKFLNKTTLDKYRLNKYNLKIEKLKSLCKDFYVDFSSNFLMKNTIGYMSDFIYGNTQELDEDSVKYYIESVSIDNFKLSLYSIKFVQILIYMAILYVGIVTIPNLAVQLLLSLTNKLLMIVFCVFALGAVSKFYFGMDLEIENSFENKNYMAYLDFFPLNYLHRILSLLFKLF